MCQTTRMILGKVNMSKKTLGRQTIVFDSGIKMCSIHFTLTIFPLVYLVLNLFTHNHALFIKKRSSGIYFIVFSPSLSQFQEYHIDIFP